jgi:hypothetical protein
MSLCEELRAHDRNWRFDFGIEEKADYAYAFFNADGECFAISSLHLDAVVKTLAEILDDSAETGLKFTVRLMQRKAALEAFSPNQSATKNQQSKIEL